jgi:hypothetical protein
MGLHSHSLEDDDVMRSKCLWSSSQVGGKIIEESDRVAHGIAILPLHHGARGRVAVMPHEDSVEYLGHPARSDEARNAMARDAWDAAERQTRVRRSDRDPGLRLGRVVDQDRGRGQRAVL